MNAEQKLDRLRKAWQTYLAEEPPRLTDLLIALGRHLGPVALVESSQLTAQDKVAIAKQAKQAMLIMRAKRIDTYEFPYMEHAKYFVSLFHGKAMTKMFNNGGTFIVNVSKPRKITRKD